MKMKKSAMAAAAMLAAGAACAQSSVTLFGVVDVNVQHGSGSVASRTQVGGSGYNSSRLGFRGTEDLGGGLSASFWLEAGLNVDNGTGIGTNTNNQASGAAPALGGGQGLAFHRRSTVSLAGPFGELRLGRDYTPAFWNLAIFDPFGTTGMGTNQIFLSEAALLYPAGTGTSGPSGRGSNSIGYFLPANLGGFYGQAMYYLGENARTGAATQNDGNGGGLRVGYAKGPFNAALGYGLTKYASGDVRTVNLGAQWDFGPAKVMGVIARDHLDTAAGVDGRGFLVGAAVPAGPGEFRVSYARYRLDTAARPDTRKVTLGYNYNLSKRTALYATLGRLKNSGGANQALNGATTAANGSSTGYDVGVRHSF